MITALHVVASLGAEAGGPSRTVPGLCHSLKRTNCVVPKIIAGTDPTFGSNVDVRPLELHTLAPSANRHEFSRVLEELLQDSSILLHDHGQWLAANRAAAEVARRRRIARITTPRGMLSPWALKHRRWKKQLAWMAYARRDIHSADVLHATSRLEADELRDLGLRQPIAVIPNGVDEIDLSEPVTLPSELEIKLGDDRILLFMSRIHVKKGVPELLDVWRRIDTDGWRLVIAGPDESGLMAGMSSPSDRNVVYAGPVAGRVKNALLRRAALFVLPSYSENFGVVVAESLMAETPVITTNATPWQLLNSERAGWCGDVGRESLERMLITAMSTDPQELLQMGKRGRVVVREQFSWDSIGVAMAEVYRWMLESGATPRCVVDA